MKIQITILLMFCFFTAFSQEEEQETKVLKGKTKVKSKSDFNLKGIYVGLFPSASAIISPLSESWGNKDEGLGLFQGFGGTAEIGMKVTSRNIAILSAGKENWAVSRRLIANKEVLFKETYHLNTIPIKVGLKHFMSEKMYVTPMVGIQGLKLEIEDNEGIIEELASGKRLAAELKIGRVKDLRFLKIDFGIHYKFIYSKDFNSIKSSVHHSGLFLGLSI